MFFQAGTFEWFRDVLGLLGDGIVLRNTHPHVCGGKYLTKTLHDSHATVEECDVFFGGRVSHNGFKFKCHPNENLRLFITGLFRRVHQIDDSRNHDISRTFTRGVFVEVKRELKVNWTAFAVVTCHWGKKIFVPHPLWANVDTAATTGLHQLLLSCRKSLAESEEDTEMKHYLDFNTQKLTDMRVFKGKEVKLEDHSSLVLEKLLASILDGPVMNFKETGPSHVELDTENPKLGTVEGFEGPGLKSAAAILATVKLDTTVILPSKTLLKVLTKEAFLSRHGVIPVLLHGVMRKWKTVCGSLKSWCYCRNLMKENEKNDTLEETQEEEDLHVKEHELLNQERTMHKLQEAEFVSSVSKMEFGLFEDKFKDMMADTILKVGDSVQKRRVGKMLGSPKVLIASPCKKKRSPPMNSDIE